MWKPTSVGNRGILPFWRPSNWGQLGFNGLKTIITGYSKGTSPFTTVDSFGCSLWSKTISVIITLILLVRSASVVILIVTMTFIPTVIFIHICSFHSFSSALIPAIIVISSIVSSQWSLPAVSLAWHMYTISPCSQQQFQRHSLFHLWYITFWGFLNTASSQGGLLGPGNSHCRLVRTNFWISCKLWRLQSPVLTFSKISLQILISIQILFIIHCCLTSVTTMPNCKYTLFPTDWGNGSNFPQVGELYKGCHIANLCASVEIHF